MEKISILCYSANGGESVNLKKKQILCLILALFVFFTGVCFEQIEADSLFSFTLETEPSSYVGTYEVTILKAELCTAKMLGIHDHSYLGKDTNKTVHGRKNIGKTLEFYCTNIGSTSFSNFYATVNAVFHKKLHHNFVILTYIHNADGKKRNKFII